MPKRQHSKKDIEQLLSEQTNVILTADRGAMIGKFNPKDQTFTFYPKPQFGADTPKIQLTKDGAIWFAPRGSRDAPAISVLYPDMDKITTFGAYYLNGPPGYPYKFAAPTAKTGQ